MPRAVVDRVCLRKASKRARVSLDTSFPLASPVCGNRLLNGIVEADETLIRKSAKGSRGLVGRVSRKRGGKPKKTETPADDHKIVLVARERHKATSDRILYDLEAHSFDKALDPLMARDAVLVTAGRPCYITFARERDISHVKLVALKGERVSDVFHIQNVNAYVSRLKGWMAPFRGVASKYLANYLSSGAA